MRGKKTSGGASGGAVLTLVIVFALVAVVELTRTLIAAQTIDMRVTDITGSVQGANSHLATGCNPGDACSDALPVLSRTESIVAQIDGAAKPLAGQAGQILTSVNSINVTASEILTTALSIDATAKSINGLVVSINGSVKSIDGSINGIDGTVLAIRGSPAPGSPYATGVAGINNRADAIISLVTAIKGDTGTIRSQADGILTQAHGISCDRVAGIVGPVSATC